ncbi:MAG: ABC transporter permease [Actinomycetota bacterium]|nr:ABC transporter permease [Actinomycetota bacterium]
MTDILTPTSVTAASGDPTQTPRRRRPGRLAVPYLLTVWFLVTLNFLLPRAMPGDPISALEDPSAPTYVRDDAAREALARHYGLNRPLANQYAHYLGSLVRGDLGESIRYNASVSGLVAERLPWTLLLVGAAMVIASAVGLSAGVQSAWRRGRSTDRWLLGLFLGVRNFPVFFLGSLALFVFAVKLRWLPLAGASTPFSSLGIVSRVVDVGRHLVLPASVLAVQFAAGDFLLMRAAMVSELGADYLVVGRVKGLRQRRLKYGYAARNALLPVVTLMALQIGFAVTGSIFVETLFAYPGMGRLVFDAVAFRDYPVLQACFLVLTLVVVTVNLGIDLLYARLDPRTAA